MNKIGKRILIGGLVGVLIGGSAAGGLYWKENYGSKPVNVYNVSELSNDDWGDKNES